MEYEKQFDRIMELPLQKLRGELVTTFSKGPFTKEKLEQFLTQEEELVKNTAPELLDSFAAERVKITEAVESGAMGERANLSDPLLQLAWAAAMAAEASVDMQHARDGAIRKAIERHPMIETYRKLFAFELDSSFPGASDIRMGWIDSEHLHVSHHFDPEKRFLGMDIIYTLAMGLSNKELNIVDERAHSAADIMHEIAHGIGTNFTECQKPLYEKMKEMKKPGLDPKEYIELAKLSAEWQSRFMIFDAAENNYANRFSANHTNHINPYDYAINCTQAAYDPTHNNKILEGTANVGKNALLAFLKGESQEAAQEAAAETAAPDNAPKKEIGAAEILENLRLAIDSSFFKNNGFFEATEENWRKHNINPDLISYADPEHPGERISGMPALEELMSMCKQLEKLQPAPRDSWLPMGEYKKKIAKYSAERNAIIDEIYERFASQLMPEISKDLEDQIKKDMEMVKKFIEQVQKAMEEQAKKAEEEAKQDGQKEGESKEGKDGEGKDKGKEGDKGEGKGKEGDKGEGKQPGGKDGKDGEGKQPGEGKGGKGGGDGQGEGQPQPGDGEGQGMPSGKPGFPGSGNGKTITVNGVGEMPDIELPPETPHGKAPRAKDGEKPEKGKGPGKEGGKTPGEGKGKKEDKDNEGDKGKGEGKTVGELLQEYLADQAMQSTPENPSGGGKGAQHQAAPMQPAVAIRPAEWSEYLAITQANAMTIKMVQKMRDQILKQQISIKKTQGRKHDLIPEDGNADRFDAGRHADLITKIITGQQVGEQDSKRFLEDDKILKTLAPIDVYIVLDISGSMEGKPFDTAINAATVIYEGFKSAKKGGVSPVNVHISTLGGDMMPQFIAKPGDSHTDIGKRIAGARGAIGGNTHLRPALKLVLDKEAGQKFAKDQEVGQSFVFVVTDCAFSDTNQSLPMLNTLAQGSDHVNMDFLQIPGGEHWMEGFTQTVASTNAMAATKNKIGVTAVDDIENLGPAMIGMLKARMLGKERLAKPYGEVQKGLKKVNERL